MSDPVEQIIRLIETFDRRTMVDSSVDEALVLDTIWLARLRRGTSAIDPEAESKSDMEQPPPPSPPESTPSDEKADDVRVQAPSVSIDLPPQQTTPMQEEASLVSEGIRFSGRGGELLADRMGFQRALRPLKQFEDAPGRHEFDAELTAQRSAEFDLLLPQLRPARERWLDLEVVVDASPSMAIWKSSLESFKLLVSRSGIFRQVRFWSWQTDLHGSARQLARDWPTAASAELSPQAILGTPGRQWVLVLSDTVSDGWRGQRVYDALETWSQSSVVTLMPTLPSSHLSRTGFAVAESAIVKRAARKTRGCDLRYAPFESRQLFRFEGESIARMTEREWRGKRGVVPVCDFSASSLLEMTRFIAGIGADEVMGVRLPQIASDAESDCEPSDVGEVFEVRSLPASAISGGDLSEAIVSHEAQLLARYLAALGYFSLGVMRLVRQTMVPRAFLHDEAEVLFSGWVEVLRESEDPEQVIYYFPKPIRDALKSELLRGEGVAVIDRMFRYWASAGGLKADSLELFIQQAGEGSGVTAEGESLASIALDSVREFLPELGAERETRGADPTDQKASRHAVDEGQPDSHESSEGLTVELLSLRDVLFDYEQTSVRKSLDATAKQLERFDSAYRALDRGEKPDPAEINLLESTVMPRVRPAIEVLDGGYARPSFPWEHLADFAMRKRLEAAIGAVGLITVADHPKTTAVGTGFVVGMNLVMTSRDVANAFALGEGSDVRMTREARFDLAHCRSHSQLEAARNSELQVTRVVMMHPHLEVALLEVQGDSQLKPLTLSPEPLKELADREVAVISHPSYDKSQRSELQRVYFGHWFAMKHLMPGKVTQRKVDYAGAYEVVTLDVCTVGDHSGAPVVNLATGTVLGLQIASRYLEGGYAIPAYELARDEQFLEAGVLFDRRVESDGPTEALDVEVVDLEALIKSCIVHSARNHTERVRMVTPHGRLRAIANASGLRKVVNELIRNGLKAAPNGDVTIRCESERGGWTLSVTDTGVGITEELQRSIFNKGFHGTVEKIADKGTGLGLYLVKQLVTAMRGTVNVRSRVGEGATFEVWLPSAEETNDATGGDLGPADTEELREKAMRIRSLALDAVAQDDLVDGVSFFEQERELWRQIGDREREANAIVDLARTLYRRKDFRGAAVIAPSAIGIYESLELAREEVGARQQYALYLMELGRLAEARSCLLHAVDAAHEKVGDPPLEATLYDQLSSIVDTQGHRDLAREYLERALEIHLTLPDQSGAAALLCRLARFDLAANNFSFARSRTQEGIKLYESLDDFTEIPRAFQLMADIELADGNTLTAREWLEQAFKAYESQGDSLGQADTWARFASVQEALDSDDDAIVTALENAQELYEKSGETQSQASMLVRIGEKRLSAGKLLSALGRFETAARLYREAGNVRSEAWVWSQMTNLHMRGKAYERAKSAGKRTIRLMDEAGDQAGRAYAHEQMAWITFQMQDYTPALEHTLNAFDRRREVGDSDRLAEVLFNIASNVGSEGFHVLAFRLSCIGLGVARQTRHSRLDEFERRVQEFTELVDLEQSLGDPIADRINEIDEKGLDEARDLIIAAYSDLTT